VLNATGARSYVPPVHGDASAVVPFEEAMACPKVACECHPGGRRMRKLGQRVLLWGDGYAATDVAAFLADIGKELTIVTENREFAADCEVIHMYVLRKRFAQTDAEVLTSKPYKHPVDVITSTTVAEIRDGSVVLQDGAFNRTELEVDDVVACHTRPITGLYEELRAAGVNVLNVGDSVAPRNLYHAVKEGSAFGLAVDQHLLFNSNGAIIDDLPIDVLAQLTREDGPSYTAKRMLELAGISGS
jgi:thioredoxin reductase